MVNTIGDRDERILNAAIELAGVHGYKAITRDGVARQAGVSGGSVNNAFDTIDALKSAVVKAAIDRENVEIVAQALADKHPLTVALPGDLKSRVAMHLLG